MSVVSSQAIVRFHRLLDRLAVGVSHQLFLSRRLNQSADGEHACDPHVGLASGGLVPDVEQQPYVAADMREAAKDRLGALARLVQAEVAGNLRLAQLGAKQRDEEGVDRIGFLLRPLLAVFAGSIRPRHVSMTVMARHVAAAISSK